MYTIAKIVMFHSIPFRFLICFDTIIICSMALESSDGHQSPHSPYFNHSCKLRGPTSRLISASIQVQICRMESNVKIKSSRPISTQTGENGPVMDVCHKFVPFVVA
jgi:hypothetical protein